MRTLRILKIDNLPPTPSKGGGGELGYMTGDPLLAKDLLPHAVEMRKEPTFAEALLWEELRKEKLGVRFRRQHLIGKYIADFVCLEPWCGIADGADHNQQLTEKEGINVLAPNGFWERTWQVTCF